MEEDQCDSSPWYEKGQQMAHYRDQLGVRIAAVSTSDYGPCDYWSEYPPFRQALWASYLFAFDSVGYTNSLYSASGAYANQICPLPALPTDIGLKYLTPVAGPVTIDDTEIYWRLTDQGTILVFADGNDTCSGGFVQPSLIVAQHTEPESVQFGSLLTYTIRVTNTSMVTLTAIITDDLPGEVTPAGVLIWVAEIDPGDTWEEQITVTVEKHCGSLVNTVKVISQEGASGSAVRIETRVDGVCTVYLPNIWKNYCQGNAGRLFKQRTAKGRICVGWGTRGRSGANRSSAEAV